MIVRLAEGALKTKFGQFREVLYYDGQRELIAIVMGEVRGGEGVLCRVHSSCLAAHAFNSIECDCREQMELAQFQVERAGRGVIIWLEQEGKGNGHLALVASRALKAAGTGQAEAYERLGYKADAREYVRAAEILRDLEVRSITLLTSNPRKADGLAEIGIEVAGTQPLFISAEGNDELRRTYEEKVRRGYRINL